MQHHGLFNTNLRQQSKDNFKFGVAERKILIVFVYYVVFTVIALLGFSLLIRDRERFLAEVLCYFQCESRGVDPDDPCDDSSYMNHVNVAMTTASYVLLGLFPLVNFVFVVNVRELKQHLKNLSLFLFKRPKQKTNISLSDTPNDGNSTAPALYTTYSVYSST